MRLAPALLFLAACSCQPSPLVPTMPRVAADGTVVVYGPPAPVHARPIAPPGIYWPWFAEAQRCSGLTGPRGASVDHIHWLLTDETPALDSTWIRVGLYVPPDTIVLATAYAGQPYVVIHEVLHYLRQRGGHPDVPFQTCGVMDASAWLTRRVLETTLHTEAP
jgi:hypothetical protein